MSKDINFNQISEAGKSAVSKIQRYATFICIVTVLLIFSFLILRINLLTQAEPSDALVDEKISTSKRLKIDENAIKKLEELEDQNVGVQSLFEAARDNPFQD